VYKRRRKVDPARGIALKRALHFRYSSEYCTRKPRMLRLTLALFAATGLIYAAASGEVDFQRQVRPILSDNCFLCHGPDKGTRMADLRLDIQEGALAHRKNGQPVEPGKPEESLLIKRIYSNDPAFRMPPVFAHKTLTEEQKEILRRWIAQGAKWKQHWAFVPPRKAALPPVKQPGWARNPIDRFVLARMEASGLAPAPEADRRALIRRVTYDLTGLPPTAAEVEAFVKDGSPRAYEKVVDRLLASPHYGEHRAHYWLDAARYADSNGYHFDNYREMWPYRDWVIRAFNKNMRYDRFTVEQVAGDLLPGATLDQEIASGFERCSETTDEGGAILPEVQAMIAKDRADTLGTVFMGLTVGCATCHDHKFDPISQKEYYSLTAFFRNTTQPIMDMNIHDTPPAIHVPLDSDRARWEQLNAQRAELQEQFASERERALQSIRDWLDGVRGQAAFYKIEDEHYMPSIPNAEKAELPEIGAPPLRFQKDQKATAPSDPAIDSLKPFTIAMWISFPDTKDDGAVLSQLAIVSEKDDQKIHNGWLLKIDKGNLGLYDHAPAIYLNGTDGKGISARPIPEYKFKPNTWFHLVVAYDGSGFGRGIRMYVNGEPVVTAGRPEDIPQLTTSMANRSPITFGSDGDKQFFEGGGIADFRIWNRMADRQDARLLYLTTRANAAGTKQADQLTDGEKGILADLYTSALNPATGKLMLDIRNTDDELWRIERRSATTLIMQERTDRQPTAHVLYRGQYDQMRDEVHANTPSVLPPMTQSMPRNRLGLAMWLADPGNPLTSRVAVNRFWQEVFGTGIVKTAEDFGSQGEPPSHPELLDWLAVDFRDSGWDVKRLFKTMVMSATYRQSAVSTPGKNDIDPQNRLLARGPRFRMDAEMIRDTALAASGLLRPQIGGPSVKPYQPSGIWETVAMEQSNTRFYKQDSEDGLYRRSLYTFWKRAAPPASMDIFNAPSRETCVVRRERTNSPLQALVTMNDVQFVEAARNLAQNAIKSAARLDRELDFMSERLLARTLDKQEETVLAKSYSDFLAYYSSDPQQASKLLKTGASPCDTSLAQPKFAALTMVANEMLNLDETLTK